MKATASTIPWIKRRAKAIKIAAGIPLHQAQDAAARESGFSNMRHAQAACSRNHTPMYKVFLTVYWRAHQDSNESGRFTLCVPMRRPILDFLTKHEVTHRIPFVSDFKLEYQDHLERRTVAFSQESAFETVYEAAKALSFVERTGLLGARYIYGLGYPFQLFNDLEYKDRSSYWENPNDASDWLCLDEPYHAYNDRPNWAISRGIGYTAEGGLGQGIWAGGMFDVYACVFAASQMRAVELMDTLKEISKEQESWILTQAEYESDFSSPDRIANGQIRTRLPIPVPPGTIRGRSISCPVLPRQKSEWRPAEPMPLRMHNAIGPLIWALFNACSDRQRHAMRMLRETLMFWLTLEHIEKKWFDADKGNHRQYRQFEYSYRGLTSSGKLAAPAKAAEDMVATQTGQVQALIKIKNVLLEGYSDCRPLRSLLKRIDKLIDRIKSAAT